GPAARARESERRGARAADAALRDAACRSSAIQPSHHTADALLQRERRAVECHAAVSLGLEPQIARPVHHFLIREFRLFPFEQKTPRSGFIIAVHEDGLIAWTTG